MFGANMSSSEYIDNSKKDLILDKGTAQGLEDTTLNTDKKYAINFSEQQKTFCLRLCYNGANS